MTHERWDEIRQKIKDSFSVIDEYTEDLEPGTAEVLEFEGPGSAVLRASFCVQPKVLDKKTLYSHRPGSDVRVDYAYSDSETVSYLTIQRWDENSQEWKRIDETSLF